MGKLFNFNPGYYSNDYKYHFHSEQLEKANYSEKKVHIQSSKFVSSLQARKGEEYENQQQNLPPWINLSCTFAVHRTASYA